MTTKDCDTIDLIACLEVEITDRQTRRHLESCSLCRQRLDQYRRLTRAMVQSRSQDEASCPQRERTVAAAAGASNPDSQHLDRCPACRELADDIAHALAGIDKKTAGSAAPLPDAVLNRVADRKAKWQAERFKNVLDIQGVKDRKKQDEMTRAFFSSAR
jgi:predicted anti-sigma-YlaC factor YlaD